MKKISYLLLICLLSVFIFACGNTDNSNSSNSTSGTNNSTNGDTSSSTNSSNTSNPTYSSSTSSSESSTQDTNDEPDDSPIGDFAQILEEAENYSYTVVYTWLEGEADPLIFTWDVAKQGDISAVALSVSDTMTTIFLETPEYYYDIMIFGEMKTATITINDGEYDGSVSAPDLGSITDFDSSFYDLLTTEENVMVNGISTTCYTYTYDLYDYEYEYKYYIASNGIVVKVEWEYEDNYFSLEIKDFKTTNIDTSILIIPTEAGGYDITDETE